jgi:hypothetical protein
MKESSSSNLLGENLVPYLRDDAWFQTAARERAVSELTELRERMDCFDEERFAMIKELSVILGCHPGVLAKAQGSEQTREMKELAIRTRNLQRILLARYQSFLRNSYRRYSSLESGFHVAEEAVTAFRETLLNRFHSSIEPDITKTLDIARNLLKRLNKEKQP